MCNQCQEEMSLVLRIEGIRIMVCTNVMCPNCGVLQISVEEMGKYIFCNKEEVKEEGIGKCS